VTVLATSREPLGVAGERVVPVPSLATSDAVELFCDRAAAADETLVFSAAERASIAQVCERLDGIPLAIELAAGRARSLAPADLLARLDDRFRLLRGGGRGGLERHETLRGAVSWSYQLLDSSERALFDRLSVFAGSFDLAAVEAVCAGDPLETSDIVNVLGSLVIKSLVSVERADDGPARFRLLETLRQYGWERLEGDGAAEMLKDRHLAHYRDVTKAAGALYLSPRGREAGAIFEHEWDNIRSAHAFALDRGDLKAAHAIGDGIAE
jgi:predicted ATPase